jgi:hypothetical protein
MLHGGSSNKKNLPSQKKKYIYIYIYIYIKFVENYLGIFIQSNLMDQF